MRLAIPIEPETSKGSEKMASSFTDTNILCIYDSELKQNNILFINDLFDQYESENLIYILGDMGISSVVSTRFMPMAMRFFERNNIRMLKASDKNLQTIIEQFNNDLLCDFTEEDAINTGCTGSCGSCASVSCK